jgi:signal transduction histidine kinase
MTESEIALALQPFGQVANALTRAHTGAGLGVPLAKGLAELHRGTLLIESAPGQGTRVTVTLPETQRKPTEAAPKRSGPIAVELPTNVTVGGFAARR